MCIVLLDVRDWYSHSFSTYFVRGQFWIESAFVSHSNLTVSLLQYIALYEQDCIDMLMAHKAIHNNQAFSSLTSSKSAIKWKRNWKRAILPAQLQRSVFNLPYLVSYLEDRFIVPIYPQSSTHRNTLLVQSYIGTYYLCIQWAMLSHQNIHVENMVLSWPG